MKFQGVVVVSFSLIFSSQRPYDSTGWRKASVTSHSTDLHCVDGSIAFE